MTSICLKIYYVWEVQNTIKKMLKEKVSIAPKPRLYNKALISAAKETHHITRMKSIIHTLDYHLISCDISRIFDNLREDKYALTLKLLQCFIRNLDCKVVYMGKSALICA